VVNPSELLTAAADRVRDLAAEIGDKPWTVDRFYTRDGELHMVVDGEVPMVVVTDCPTVVPVIAWIAALSPAIAPMLEDLFRVGARQFDLTAKVAQDYEVSPDAWIGKYERKLITLAESILGSGVVSP
jgi:hypothetical protein